VNTNSLARHYDKLTPRERLPLIVAASAREDEQEHARLVAAAPRVGYRVPDYFGLACALREVTEQHHMEVLNTAALYFRSLGLADVAGGKRGTRLLDGALLLGYLFNVQLAGWRLFCAEHGYDPDLCRSLLPGFDTVRQAEEVASQAAFTEEGVRAYLKRKGRPAEGVMTVETVAAGLREVLRHRAGWWG
jgi:hypothetical protein